jgi:UDP-N-acetylmuramoyl-tripeptide--D-alanyl-D-alanine ligase
MHLTLDDLQRIVGGRLRLGSMPPCEGVSTTVGRIVTDSRDVRADDVFWGLIGPRFNGANFAEEALVRGATGVVTSGRWVEPWAGRWTLEVNDSYQALWELAIWCRQQFTAPLVAVTGSVGKTTTRRMIDAVLRSRLAGTTSPRNFNNHVGVPVSLMQLERWHRYAVLELAASAPGEIRRLARLSQPQIGVITCIGEAHLGGFGNQETIAASKTELLAELPAEGLAVLNADDPWLQKMADRSRAPIVWIGRGTDADVAAENVKSAGGRLSFRVAGQQYETPVWGRHHLTSALAAIAVGQHFGFDPPEIATALATYEIVPQRCEVSQTDGATIVNDCYNSSPTAMRAALELIREIGSPGKRIVVAGDMGDLGGTAPALHRRLGEDVVRLCGADLLIACGEHAGDVANAAAEAGMPQGHAIACRDWEQAFDVLTEAMETGDVVLVKGARAMGLERLVDALKARATSAAA